MQDSTLIVYGVLGLATLVLILKSVVIVREATAVVIERLGRFNRIANSGFGLIIPFIDRKAATVNLRVQQLDVSIETKTRDNVFLPTEKRLIANEEISKNKKIIAEEAMTNENDVGK